MEQPSVTIIVLNWNGLADTIECLESLRKASYPNYRVLVLDNGSRGNDGDVLEEKFKGFITVIREEKNIGFAGGNNAAMRWLVRNSPPDYFILLNNDTVVDPAFITEMVRVAEAPDIGIVGCKTYIYSQPNRFQLVWMTMDMAQGRSGRAGAGEIDQGQYDVPREVEGVQGSCFLIKRSTVDTIGLLDESFFAYWEEMDYCHRARLAGIKVYYAPKAKIWHKISQSLKGTSGLARYYITRNRIWFMRKHATRKQLASFLTVFALRDYWFESGILLLYHRDIKTTISFNRGVKDGLFAWQKRQS